MYKAKKITDKYPERLQTGATYWIVVSEDNQIVCSVPHHFREDEAIARGIAVALNNSIIKLDLSI